MTLNDHEWRNGYYAFFSPNSIALQAEYVTVLGVLTGRNPLTDCTKFGISDYVGDATQYPEWHRSVQGGDPHEGVKCQWFVLFYLFFSAAGGQTAGPILTSNIPKRTFLEIVHSFVG